MLSPEDVNELLDAADYFRSEADRQRGIIASPGSETADDANFEAKRFDRWALACERAASAAPVGQPGVAIGAGQSDATGQFHAHLIIGVTAFSGPPHPTQAQADEDVRLLCDLLGASAAPVGQPGERRIEGWSSEHAAEQMLRWGSVSVVDEATHAHDPERYGVPALIIIHAPVGQEKPE